VIQLRLIANLRSGKPRRRGGILRLLQKYAARSRDPVISLTEGPGHATQLAREALAAGCQRVVAVGGDGTVNEVAQALIRTSAALGIVPLGSGNGLARHLGMLRGLEDALDLATSPFSRTADIDTGTANGHPFINVMGLGLDAEASRRFNQLPRRGFWAYAGALLAAVSSRRSERCRITFSGRVETHDIMLIAVANSDQYGYDARIAPGGRVDDGLLDLVTVGPAGLPGMVHLGARLFSGALAGHSSVRRFKSGRFLIERPAPGIIHTDGEVHETGAIVEVTVLPGSLKVVVPALCKAVPHKPGAFPA